MTMSSLYNFEQKQINYKSNILGKVFERSALKGYDSKKFIQQLMTDKKYNNMIMQDMGQEWCDECFLLDRLERIKSFPKSKNQYKKFDLWFMGYLYKYWMSTKNKTPQEVYKMLPIDKFYNNLGFYHTQDWDYIINDNTKGVK